MQVTESFCWFTSVINDTCETVLSSCVLLQYHAKFMFSIAEAMMMTMTTTTKKKKTMTTMIMMMIIMMMVVVVMVTMTTMIIIVSHCCGLVVSDSGYHIVSLATPFCV